MEKKKAKAKVYIIPNKCKGCGFCIEFCPNKVLKPSRELNPAGHHYPELDKPENCSGCELCGMLCPDFAIWSEKRHDKKVGTSG